MTLCPVAIVAGCRKCPVVAVCPLKGVIGDYKKEDDAPAQQPVNAAGQGGKQGK